MEDGILGERECRCHNAMVLGTEFRATLTGTEFRATLTGTECRATLIILFIEQVTAFQSRLDVGLFGSPVRDAFVIAA